MAKNLAKMILPYKFKGANIFSLRGFTKFHLKEEAKFELGEDIFPSFGYVYDSVLKAMCENDLDFLNNVMEKRLFTKTKSDLERLQEQKLKLSYIEPLLKTKEKIVNESDEETDDLNPKVKIKINFRQRIIRHSNIDKKFLYETPYEYINETNDMKINLEFLGIIGAEIDRDSNTGKRIGLMRSRRLYFIEFPNVFQAFKKQILVVNVFYLTKKKLAILDEENFVVHGTEDSESWIPHIWRFETDPKKVDWVITDMDHYLEGNPYYSHLHLA